MTFLSSTLVVGAQSNIFSKRSYVLIKRSYNLQPCQYSRFKARSHFTVVAKDTFWTVCLLVGSYCVYESNLLSPLTVTTINPLYVLGSLLVPYSWGLHVAGWIQLKNGK
ncbi:hypothetical protein Gasu2_10320 [Galdieria sulphuraria]|nr:hypothetical protein Gasu2_10320 [Galdieria sulphuraria]